MIAENRTSATTVISKPTVLLRKIFSDFGMFPALCIWANKSYTPSDLCFQVIRQDDDERLLKESNILSPVQNSADQRKKLSLFRFTGRLTKFSAVAFNIQQRLNKISGIPIRLLSCKSEKLN